MFRWLKNAAARLLRALWRSVPDGTLETMVYRSAMELARQLETRVYA